MQKIAKAISGRNLLLIWVLGMAGQICWNVENQWFNTFVYAEIAPNSTIVNWMVAVSAIVTTFSTFFFGTISDRLGTRKPLLSIGYILWGIFTIVYGLTSYISHSIEGFVMVAAILLIMADAIMSFFGSMGNDSGFNAWLSDMLNDKNKSAIGTALAVQPVLGTIIGTVIGGMIVASFGYVVFFICMGILVILIGLLSIFTVKDAPKLKSYKNGSFWHQFASAFNFKRFFAMRELLLLNVMVTVFFIAFNVYFVHIGNIFIYKYGFAADMFGYIEGAALILGVFCTIPAGHFIKKNQSPGLLAVIFGINILGLVVFYLWGNGSDPANLFSLANIPLFIGIICIGVGYIVTMQTTMVWAKELYPDESRGQFEGIRILFFVLIPMVIGPMIANPIIASYGDYYTVDYGTGPVSGMVPNGVLFIVAAALSVLSFIPLYFVSKHYRKRVSAKAKEAEVALDAK